MKRDASSMEPSIGLFSELPDELLFEALQRVPPRELCRLECCCKTLHAIIDEHLWKHVFLQQRRCNVLCEPHDWKLEYKRRE